MRSESTQSFGDGRYQVVELLGQGAMGVVYKAYDTVVGRNVAIKTISTESIPPEEVAEFLRIFQAEAQAAGRLDHPGIVTVYDFNPSPDGPYIVMSLVEGGTLGAVLARRKKLEVGETIELGIQVADALEYAHQHGVQAHRDIKPGNIFLTAEGRYKVGDFGIAHVRKTSDQTTRTFLSGGTPRYMAPEQVATPRKVDGRTDMFSLCVVIYEALTGALPYQGVTLNFDPEEQPEVAQRIVMAAYPRAAPLRRALPTLPAAFAQTIDCGMHPDPALRYRSCGDFADALRRVEEGMKSATVVQQPGRPSAPVAPRIATPVERPVEVARKNSFNPTTAAVLVAMLGLAWALWPSTKPSDQEASSQPQSELARRFAAALQPEAPEPARNIQPPAAARPERDEGEEEEDEYLDEEAMDEDAEVLASADSEEESGAGAEYDGAAEAGKSGDLSAVNSDGRSGAYYIPYSAKGGAVPLMILLHGTGGAGREILRLFKPLAEEYEFAIVAPDSHLTSDGKAEWQPGKSASSTTGDVKHVHACIAEVSEMDGAKIDGARQLVVGHASGGTFAAWLASVSPEIESFGVLHGRIAPKAFGTRRVRGWFSTGSSDRVVTAEKVQSDIEELEADGIQSLEFKSFPGGHKLSEEEIAALVRWWLGK